MERLQWLTTLVVVVRPGVRDLVAALVGAAVTGGLLTVDGGQALVGLLGALFGW